MRYLIRLSFDGSAFCGWQIQNNAPSIQECLQKVLSTLLNEEVTVTGAGRTDSKVNAINYVAHFDTAAEVRFESEEMRYKLNAILPHGITVHEVSETGKDFHARFDAKKREYTYFLHRNKDPFMDGFSYLYTFPLDREKMNLGAEKLIGTHDFSCFEKIGGGNKTSICTVFSAEWSEYTPSHISLMGYPGNDGDYLMFRISADRFLRNMVRAVVGTLLEIGRGKHEPEWIRDIMDKGNRSDAGESVPGKALFLSGIRYSDIDFF
ncbi:MAG: tRNA pseudouridine(38-40) synthase TruA [Bacteroidales bacterium]|jgi:tRNA pseudouridine38-40 synthase|nr:tRNA pseudouridine(38-40) synthase TruA [Bacteroidales bacterium]MCI1785560.1 tRNA pseudouridine(38-40) synthase TruA [Bacteroidales bacterium]